MKKTSVAAFSLLMVCSRALCGLVQDGDSEQAKGNWDAAIADYTRAIEQKQDVAEAYNNRGNAERAKGELDAAITDYNQALALQTNYANAWLDRGNVKSQKGDPDGAIADYDQAIQFKPDFAIAYGSRGNTKFMKGDLDGAIADYDKAIELKPDYADILFNRRYAKIQKGDEAGEEADRSNYLKTANSPVAYFNSANLEISFNLSEAINDYRSATELDTNYVDAYYRLGDAEYNQAIVDHRNADYTQTSRDLQAALAAYSAVIQLQPSNANAYIHRAGVQRYNRDWLAAIADLKSALQANQKHDLDLSIKTNLTGVYDDYGYSKLGTNDFQGALAEFNNALGVQPDNAFALWKRGLIKDLQLNDNDGAMTDYNTDIAAHPDYSRALAARGNLKLKEGDLNGAITDYNTAIAADPNYAPAFYYRGVLKARENDLEGARADCQKAAELPSDDIYATSSAQNMVDKLTRALGH